MTLKWLGQIKNQEFPIAVFKKIIQKKSTSKNRSCTHALYFILINNNNTNVKKDNTYIMCMHAIFNKTVVPIV